MKEIALILPPWLPVPAVKGGAIETLMTLLADENEKYGKVRSSVFSIYDKEACAQSKKYIDSDFYFIKLKKSKLISKSIHFASRVFRKLFVHDFILSEYYRKVFSICRKKCFDAIIAEGGEYFEFRRFSRQFGREKMYLHIHCHLQLRPDLAGIFGNTISVSHYVNNAWIQSCKDKTSEEGQKHYVVVNAVDEELFTKEVSLEEKKAIRTSVGISDDDILLLYIGRIIEVKGVFELIQATLSIKNPKVKLLVIGSINFAKDETSPYLKKITELIKNNPQKIKQLGYIDNKEVYKYAKSADIRVLPSKWEEAGSLALIESLHAGIPIIITRSGGMPEVICHDGAVIIEKDENLVQNIADAVEVIISQPEKMKQMQKANSVQSQKFRKSEFYDTFVKIFDAKEI
ncbi:MAG: glycosyltransferase family 4 protein [Treponema sp.]|nr:glycosyltransferase family 4 protein [Treponema sp.]